jgi:hypothetical protein
VKGCGGTARASSRWRNSAKRVPSMNAGRWLFPRWNSGPPAIFSSGSPCRWRAAHSSEAHIAESPNQDVRMLSSCCDQKSANHMSAGKDA